jgi:hypothetical protein
MRTSAIPRYFPTFLAWLRGLLAWLRGLLPLLRRRRPARPSVPPPKMRLLTNARLALITLVWLFVVAGYSTPSARCLWFHEVVINGRVYEGPCASVGQPEVALLLMAPSPLAAAAAICRPHGSLKRALGLIALVAVELALIFDSFPGRVLRYPQLRVNGDKVIVDPHPNEEGHFPNCSIVHKIL